MEHKKSLHSRNTIRVGKGILKLLLEEGKKGLNWMRLLALIVEGAKVSRKKTKQSSFIVEEC